MNQEPSNKGMKLTRPEHIGASQLNPSVRRLVGRGTWASAQNQTCHCT